MNSENTQNRPLRSRYRFYPGQKVRFTTTPVKFSYTIEKYTGDHPHYGDLWKLVEDRYDSWSGVMLVPIDGIYFHDMLTHNDFSQGI